MTDDAVTAAPTTATPATPAPATPAPASADPVISLLVVDDHPVVRDGLRGMFESAPGFRVG
ncbi:hypothetical protein [Streptomyces violaceorubidus]|uniref:hypothetical protein n=1 Tax=Streptomyces violaceorubidus TaxID=284042 RepID=UPI003D9EB12C